MKKKVITILFFCLLFGVGFLVYNGQRNLQMKELYYSGTIEAKQAELGFQVSGRIVEVVVNENALWFHTSRSTPPLLRGTQKGTPLPPRRR